MSSNTNKEEKKDLGCEYHEICEKCGYPEMKKRKKKSAPQPEKQEKKRSGFMFYSDMPKEEIEDTIPEKQDVPSPNPSYDTYYKQSEEAISDIKSEQEDELLKSFLNDTEKQKIISMVGGITCQCGNPILLDRVNEVWFNIIDKTIKSKLEALEDIAYKVCNGDDDCIDNFTELWQEIKAELLNKHK
jgi:hypothetical protein